MRSVLITGGTGSLGQALTRHLLADDSISRIAIFSRDEWKQAEMAKAFGVSTKVRYFLGDVRDPGRLNQALVGVDHVIHTAALKRVDAVAYNPSEVIKTNVQGTMNVIEAAVSQGVSKVMLVSSDKAVQPTNIYGVTKAAAEHYAISSNSFAYPQGTRVSVVRYGNVLGSRGSVVLTWRDSVARGDIPKVNPDCTRFWLTMRTAVAFVLEAIKVMQGGEIFVPKLKAALIRTLAAAYGLQSPVPWDYCPLRPGGEKLHESLLSPEEITRTYDAGFAWMVKPSVCSWREWPKVGEPYPYRTYYSGAAPQFTVEELRDMLLSEGLIENANRAVLG